MMQNSFRWSVSRLLLPCLVALALLAAKTASADFIVTLTQQGSNVVATGSGAIDLTGLGFNLTGLGGAALSPIGSFVGVGPVLAPDDVYAGTFSGPANFGLGGFTSPSSGSGDIVIIDFPASLLAVPAGYVSNSPLSDSSNWDHATFSSLGVTPGTYEWTWGSGANQKFILEAMPEPSSLGLLAVALLAFAGIIGFRKKKPVVTG